MNAELSIAIFNYQYTSQESELWVITFVITVWNNLVRSLRSIESS